MAFQDPEGQHQIGREATAEGGRPSLDLSTQLVKSDGITFGWKLTLWPECSEASLVYLPKQSDKLRGSRSKSSSLELPTIHIGDLSRILAETYELAAENWRVANGRAASRSRRYFVANRLRYMWVLTFAQSVFNRREAMALVGEFVRRLRVANSGSPFAYWYSPELHPGGHGWHVNLFVASRIEHALVEGLWGHGFVWVTDFASDRHGPKGEPLGLCRTPRDGWRRAAAYGCKYAQKDWSPESIGRGNHRYEIAQGFSPTPKRLWVTNRRDAEWTVREIVEQSESRDLQIWDSRDEAGWQRPPIRTWRW